MRACRALLIAISLFGGAVLARPADAQSFGKNKVQYEALSWQVLETPHVRMHFYAEEESLARSLAAFAESVSVEYDGRFRLKFRHPIPILLYSTHHLFQQTNATPELLSESVGGLTELIKGRVLIPHNGSWARLRWVTRHELAHAYMLEKLGRVMHDHHRTQQYLPDLWFTEGLAEYCGTTWDAEAEGLLRDMVTTRRAFPLLHSEMITGTVMMYKEGQSFLLYLADRFGDERIFDLLDNWWRADDFETAFRITYGLKLAEVDDAWFESIKKRYYPTVATCDAPKDIGKKLTPNGHYNLGPRALPARSDSDSVASFCWLAARDGATDLMVSGPDRHGKRRERRLLRGGASPSFESFHLFQNRPDTSPSGLIALSSKRGGRDALYVIDPKRDRVLRRLQFPNLVAVHDPSFLPGDSGLVFTAQDYGGRSDLYRTTWPGGHVQLERLTRDDFDDLDPDVSPDGRWVAFASDRADLGGHYGLYRMSLVDGTLETLSRPASGDDRQPVYSPDGAWIAFRSTRGGTSDLYVRHAEPSASAARVTKLLGPASDPDWRRDGRGLLFTAESAVEFQTWYVRVNPDSLTYEPETPPALLAGSIAAPDSTPRRAAGGALVATREASVLPVTRYAGPASPYERRLGLDLLQNGVGFDPVLGGGGGGQIVFSDVLGNEQLLLSLSNDSERFGNFWDGWEGGLTYFNESRRLHYGLGAFRLTQVYDADLDEVRREKRVGLVGLTSYPFNKFTRIEGSMLVRHATDHLLRDGEQKTVDLVSNFATLVHDNVRWTWDGPTGGIRAFLSAGFTRDMTSGRSDFGTLIAEARHYRSPIPHVIYASRVNGQASVGRDAQRYYIGGPMRLRGYERRAISGLQTVLVQQELRLPVLQGLTLAVPALWQFPTISAAAFADGAWAWEDGIQRQLGDVGAAIYIGGGVFPAIRWNWAWNTTDFQHYAKHPVMQFSLGFNY